MNFVRRFYPGLGSCLQYHRITEDSATSSNPYIGLAVNVERFEEQMRHLRQNFHCLDVPTAVNLLMEGKLPNNVAMVTFDDGFRDNMSLGLPILEKYDFLGATPRSASAAK